MFRSAIVSPGHIPNPCMGVHGGQRTFSGGGSVISFGLWAGHSGCSVNSGLLEGKSGGT